MKHNDKTVNAMTKIAINPLNTGIGIHSAIISEEMWISTSKAFIEKHGSEAFLRAMLQVMQDQANPSRPMF